MATRTSDGTTVIATNRVARRDYDVLDTWECGVVLRGAEVKALREAKVQLADSYARLVDDEVWVFGISITAYSHASKQVPPEPVRERKLLLHRHQIDLIADRQARERLQLIPLSLYFRDGRVKLELALARSRRKVDKRQLIAERDAEMEARRAMARGGRGR
ncbi:SsrA-binding protein SmpB [Iamia majanohamensis]|uniref:SsrA-binding protein n=1 Tax=Iamia majanohamensis TaxID=467976 RepID=A0AAE9YCL6_9ACTN|nr:SsrA-binding protein SmpB [Iamia majanohamensis]WCO68748.1 SsrA-binding protein SmpB [Iamia majanohamensis]